MVFKDKSQPQDAFQKVREFGALIFALMYASLAVSLLAILCSCIACICVCCKAKQLKSDDDQSVTSAQQGVNQAVALE